MTFASLGATVASFSVLLRNGDFIVAELVDLSSCLTISRARLTTLSGRTLRRISAPVSHLSSALQNYFHSMLIVLPAVAVFLLSILIVLPVMAVNYVDCLVSCGKTINFVLPTVAVNYVDCLVSKLC